MTIKVIPPHPPAPPIKPATDLLQQILATQTATNTLLQQIVDQDKQAVAWLVKIRNCIIIAMILAFLVVPACRGINEMHRNETERAIQRYEQLNGLR